MAQTAKRLIAGSALTGSAATYYTAPTGTTTVIKKLSLINTTGSPIAATVYLVASGGTAAATNTITSSKVIASNETWSSPECENQVLPAGGFIQALGNGLTIIASGIEIT